MTATPETFGATEAVQAAAPARPAAEAHGQQHPLRLYLIVWILLFVLSTGSYLVDYFDIHGYLRWFLIVLFMLLKAGAIVAVFMHMAWERLALVVAILSPPMALMVLLGLMAFEGDYTNLDRTANFAPVAAAAPAAAAPAVERRAPETSSVGQTPVKPSPQAETRAQKAPAVEKLAPHRLAVEKSRRGRSHRRYRAHD